MTHEEREELSRQKRAERNKAKMALERQKKRQKQIKNADKEKEKAKSEVDALNNKVNHSDKVKNVRAKFEQKAKATIGISEKNKKWEQKRKERYNQRVWRGWRVTDGEESPVISYNLEDLDSK